MQDAADWKQNLGLTFPVLSDSSGNITLTYDNFGGWPLTPWDAIVSADWVLCYSESTYEVGQPGGNWDVNVLDVIAIFDSLYAPVIAADPGQLDFGSVDVGSSAPLNVTLDNAGTGLLDVSEIQSTSPDFSVTPSVGQIYAVEDSLVIEVTFTPTQAGVYEDTLTVISADDTLQIPVTGVGVGAGIEPEIALPKTFSVACYPNPFNPSTTISYQLAAFSSITLKVYDTGGEIVARLMDGWQSPGEHTAIFDGSELSSGIYLYVLQVGDFRVSGKLVLLK